jgi:hypothetical protein
MPNPNLTSITIVLDRSGSMESLRESTVAGINQFLRGQRELPGEARLTLVQFDDRYEVHKDNVNLREVQDLTQEDFQPRGSTALLDAIGKGITDLGNRLAATPEELRPGKVIFVIQTDGYENASREFNYARIQDMISLQRDKYQWQFLFLAAGQDAIAAGGALGIQAGATMSYNANAGSTRKAFQVVNRSLGSYRSGISGQTVVDSFSQAYVSNDAVAVNAAMDSTLAPVALTPDQDALNQENAQKVLDAFNNPPDGSNGT